VTGWGVGVIKKILPATYTGGKIRGITHKVFDIIMSYFVIRYHEKV